MARKPLPKPTIWLRLGWRLEALGYDLFTAAFRALPVDVASGLGGWLLKTIGPLTPTDRLVRRNLKLAFPELPKAEVDRLVKAQWENCGRVFAEFPIMDRLTIASGRVTVVNGERLDAIRDSGRPVVFVSGHFANWEIMPSTIVAYRVPCQMTYRAANNPHVDERIKRSRARYGVMLFAPKGRDGARELLEGLGRGESVALMNDQKFNKGVAAPFMGHPAHTAPGPSQLALRFDTVLQPMTVRRLKGARFEVVVCEPIELEDTGDRARDIEAGVAKVNAFIEARVREHPDDWFWVHKRWANEAYAGLDSPSA